MKRWVVESVVLGGEEVGGGWERRSMWQWLGFLRRTKNEDERGVDWVSKREGIFFPSVRRRRLRERKLLPVLGC